jgi:UDP-N-acetylglucosamine 2-epimerase (non-hydrolysing)
MIYVIIGTKAQLIKMAPIMIELQQRKIKYFFIFSGQHKETIDDLLVNFNIKKPDIILYKGKDITNIFQAVIWIFRVLIKTFSLKEKIYSKKKSIILTHGDTFTTVLGALIGKFFNIKVAHIESGLRSFNFFNPFPEEINRVITFYLTDYYFAPNDWAVSNLKRFKGKKFNTDRNTLYDSLKLAIKNEDIIKLELPPCKYVVISIHRFENIFDSNRLKNIVKILNEISKKFYLIFILHLPTLKNLKKFGLIAKLDSNKNIELRKRMDYFSFIKLIYHSEFIISDGGSNQEECYYLNKPCLLLRNKTERIEGIGENVLLSNYKREKINYFVKNYTKMVNIKIKEDFNPSKKIVDSLIKEGFNN